MIDPQNGLRLAHIIPPPAERRAPTRPTEWAVGIMAAKRDSGASYLPQCIRSLQAAGFPDPVVFAEPGTPGVVLRDGCPVVEETGTPATINGVRLGVFPNHLAMLQALVRGQAWQNATAFLLVEDDTIYTPGLREYLDQYVLWPCNPVQLGALCLFTHGLKRISVRTPGWHRLTPEVFRALWGGQALVMSRPGLERWIASPLQNLHREHSVAALNRYPDGRLSEFCALHDMPIYFPVGLWRESPVDHVGHHSSVFGFGKNGKARRFAADTLNAPLINALVRKKAKVKVRPIGGAAGEEQLIDAEGAERRKARRAAVCQQCPALKDGACSACKCSDPPTLHNIGDLKRICTRGRWSEVGYVYRPQLQRNA